MKIPKYKEELRKLYIIMKKENGYRCGYCPECKKIYKEFMKIVRKIKKEGEGKSKKGYGRSYGY